MRQSAGAGPCQRVREPDVEQPRRRRWDSLRAEALFWQRVADLGGRAAADAAWVSVRVKVPLICAEGHATAAYPNAVNRGGGICRVCAGLDPVVAEAKFWARVTEVGARPAPGARYVNVSTPVSLICRRGHPCSPMPASLAKAGPCRTCVGIDPVAAEQKFWEHVAAAGARPVPGASYRNGDTPVPLICAEGHPCRPRPAALKRQGPCWVCSGHEPASAEARFWDRVTAAGGRPAPGATYNGAMNTVELLCGQGHRVLTRPSLLQQGHRLCRECSTPFDRVYLLTHRDVDAVKVGIAAVDSRVREHRSNGYELVCQWRGLDHRDAVATEKEVLKYWRDTGWGPVRAAPGDGWTETARLPPSRPPSASWRAASVALADRGGACRFPLRVPGWKHRQIQVATLLEPFCWGSSLGFDQSMRVPLAATTQATRTLAGSGRCGPPRGGLFVSGRGVGAPVVPSDVLEDSARGLPTGPRTGCGTESPW